jgi:hypothetical protein
MATHRGAEDARKHLPELLDAAERATPPSSRSAGGRSRRFVPVEAYKASERQPSLLPLYGSGRGIGAKTASASCATSGTVTFDDLSGGALLLVDSPPVIYALDGHPTQGQKFRRLFKAQA